MKKRTIFSLIVTIVFFLSIVIYATYAAVSASVYVDNLNIETNLGNGTRAVFVTTGSGELASYVTPTNMAEEKVGNVAGQATGIINATLTSPSTTPALTSCCTYDIIWEWEETDNIKGQYHKTANNEFTLSGTLTETYTPNGGSQTTYINNKKIFEAQLPDYNASSLANTVYNLKICNVGPSENQEWSLATNFYNLNTNQDGMIGSTFKGNARIGNAACFVENNDKSYWYSTSSYTFPSNNGSTYYFGPLGGHLVYTGQDSTKYYACANYGSYGKEVCLSQPYTQYGLTGHTPGAGQYFTVEQQASAKAALLQVFNDIGINITSSNCSSSTTSVRCGVSNISCVVNWSGAVHCQSNSERLASVVLYDGSAYCAPY